MGIVSLLGVIKSQVLLRSVWFGGRNKEINVSNNSLFRRVQDIIRVIRVRDTQKSEECKIANLQF